MPAIALLLPRVERLPAPLRDADGLLARWVARADAAEDQLAGSLPAWRSVLNWPGQSLSIAALTRAHDVGDAVGSTWIRADPAHVRADMSTARMLACGEVGLTVDEVAAFLRELKPLFGDSGFVLDAPCPQRWYLRALTAADVPDGADPDDVIGDDLKLHLPQGAAGRRWRMLFNEVQVILHNHPVNKVRVARGAVGVNGLWFWGAGQLPDWVRSPYRAVISNQPALQTMARIGGMAHAAREPAQLTGVLAKPDEERLAIIDLADLRDATLTTDWLEPIDAALRRGALDHVELVFESGERVRVRSSYRWRFWRRSRGLGS